MSKITMYGKGHMQKWRNSVCLISNNRNRENISNHAFCLIKVNRLKKECYFNNIAPKDTQMRIKVISWGHKNFVGLCFLDLANETIS